MKRKHVAHEFTQTNTAKPEVVFPLLCPVREADWVPDWKYKLLHSNSGFAEPGCVFTTPNEDGTETTWICTHHDAVRNEVSYAWVCPGMIATRLTIALSPAGDKTLAKIRYEYTGLSDAGDRELERYDRAWYEAKMRGWESAINHYLQTGTRLATHNRWE